ncbi:glycosyl hydrolase family 8 [Halobacillus litoralis]|uniref:glycosyl hydrolase family 8 n=1 Tax=Halobacillus litoralis TaxID=45668 RepID=UPI00136D31F0|nr:glycosyl hydrolase family 8 [Halobacillus litoralis]MYL36324.1 glycosyl hydrolase [Halobacillus litoralis]
MKTVQHLKDKGKKTAVWMSVILLVIIGGRLIYGNEDNQDTLTFLKTSLTNDNHTPATYMKPETALDSDEVQGRESLSESMGFLLLYAVEAGKESLFEEQYQLLVDYFMDEEGLIYWKIDSSGSPGVPVNALVDDLRIVKALYAAGDQWNKTKYTDTAEQAGSYISRSLTYQSTLVDYSDQSSGGTAHSLTLSYIDVEGIDLLRQQGHIDPDVYDTTIDVLEEAEPKNVFYPKAYSVEKDSFSYDEEINMIDQMITANNRAQLGLPSNALISFIKEEMEQNGVLYGRYNPSDFEPVVKYESPAVYGFLIMYAIQLEDKELALKAYDRMTAFRSNHMSYRGGYSIHEGNTHIFDNLVPLLAIEKLKHTGWI